jgi:putative ABC transport system permease protein
VQRFWLNFGAAAAALTGRWQRSLLTSTGIMVAVVAITLLIGVGKGVQTDITKQIKDLGVNVLIVFPARIDPSAMQMNPNMGGQSYLKREFAREIEKLAGVERAAVLTFTGGGVSFGEKDSYPVNIAAEPAWFGMHQVELREGKLYDATNDDEYVCVIGSIAADELFGEKVSALGKEVKINGQGYRIIGVTKDQSSEDSLFSMASFQNVVYVPWDGFKKRNANAQIDRIMVQSKPEAEPKSLVAQMEKLLGSKLDEQQYSVLTQEQLLGLIYKLMQILTYLVTGLTGIALFVGGVGIMTVMLMSVSERTKEIGVRKTVGACRKDVFQQFLAEAILLSLFGGVVGITLSVVVGYLLATLTVIKPEISPSLAAFSMSIALGIGILFGILPALNAAKKHPVEALRIE